MFTDCVPDEIYLPCWHSLRTTCKWCQPSQLALIQTWDRRPNIRQDRLFLLWQFSALVHQILAQLKAKLNKIAHWLSGRRLNARQVKKRKKEIPKNIYPSWYMSISVQSFLHRSLLHLPLTTFSIPPGALWWKNGKWSRFCEHHLAARTLIAPITSLTFLPTYKNILVHKALFFPIGKKKSVGANRNRHFLCLA